MNALDKNIDQQPDFDKFFEQIDIAQANGFVPDQTDPNRVPENEEWFVTSNARLVVRGDDGADLYVFETKVDLGAHRYTIRFDGDVPASVFEAAINARYRGVIRGGR